MKDSISLQPAWVFPPFFVLSEDSGLCIAQSLRSKEHSFFIFHKAAGEEKEMYISRAARLADLQGESKVLVWSLILRHLSWSISLSHSWLSSHILISFSLPEGPLNALPPLAQNGGEGQLRRLMPQEPETLRGCNFPFPTISEAGRVLGTRVKANTFRHKDRTQGKRRKKCPLST